MSNETNAPHFQRLITIDVPSILLLIAHERDFVINGFRIKTGTPRLRTYLKGTTCASCGIVGNFFAVEAQKPDYTNYHLNLYGLNPTGQETLITSDHIVPRAKKGRGNLQNRQTLCQPCNQAKADT